MNRFFDTGTRAIMMQVVLYNTNTRQLTNVRMLIEIYMSSDFQMTYTMDTAKLVVYQSKTDQVPRYQYSVFHPSNGVAHRRIVASCCPLLVPR